MNARRLSILTVVSFMLLAIAGACIGGDSDVTPTALTSIPSAAASTPNLSLTVYNQGSALVRDRRQFELSKGFNEIAFREVAASIDPTSVLFKSITDPEGLVVLEQNYVYDLVGTSALLNKYLDQKIQVVTNDGEVHAGLLLSGRDDLILQESSGEVTVIKSAEIQRFSFPELPDGLITRPTLVWQLLANQAGTQDVEITYLTSGISWRADYVLLLADDDSSLDLDGWITLNNTSGATFEDAQLKLIAGDLQRISPEGYAVDRAYTEEMPLSGAAPVEEREFFEYHLYEIPRPVTVHDNESKQIEFVSAAGVPAEKFFVYDGLQCRGGYWYCSFYGSARTDPSYGIATNTKVMVMVEFDTENVDADLPAGRIRLYQQDIDGAALLIGEDSIDHTPKGEEIRLYVGDAFDIVGERIQTDFRRPRENVLEEDFKITLRNHKDEAAEVRVVEHLSRWSEWRITSSTSDYVKMDSSTIEFRVNIPANGERTIRYTVRYEWP